MARGGVNKAVVQAARLAILARGENPVSYTHLTLPTICSV